MESEQLAQVAAHLKALMGLEATEEALQGYLAAHPEVGQEGFILEGLALAERLSVSASLQTSGQLLARLHQLAVLLASPYQAATHLALGRQQLLQGDLEAADLHVAAAETLAEKVEQSGILGNIHLERASLHLRHRAHEEARASLELAGACFEQAEEQGGQSQVALMRGRLFLQQGLFEEAEGALDTALQMQKQGEAEPVTLANILTTMGMLYQAQGRPSEAEDALQKALPIYQSANDPRGLAGACRALGLLYRSMGDLEGAEAGLHNALQIFQQLHAKHEIITVYRELAEVFVGLGREAEAETCQKQAELLAGKG